MNAADQAPLELPRGGLQVSFWKAVKTLEGPPMFVPHDVAVRVLAGALSDRQWELLAERHPRNGVPM